jgi:hypothetical protein
MSGSAPSGGSQSMPKHARLLTPAETDHQMALADGALGAAGHHVDDPDARAILRRQASGEISGEDARNQLLTRARRQDRINGSPEQAR